MGIIAGKFNYTKKSKESEKAMRATMAKYPDAVIDTTSHSLGAYAQMHMMHNNSDIRKRIRKQYLFNPGAAATDLDLTDYAADDKNHFFIKHGDIISAGMVIHTRPKNLKLLSRNLSLNPLKNHTIHNFTSSMNNAPIPPHKDHGEIKYDKEAEYPEKHLNPHELLI